MLSIYVIECKVACLIASYMVIQSMAYRGMQPLIRWLCTCSYSKELSQMHVKQSDNK